MASHAGVWRADACNSSDAPNGAGSIRALSRGEAIAALADSPHVLLNAPLVAARLGLGEVSGLDLLELFAFVRPAHFAVPSASGLASELGLAAPGGAAEAGFLQLLVAELMALMQQPQWAEREGAWDALDRLARRGWLWAPLLVPLRPAQGAKAKSLFEALDCWEDVPPRPAARVRTLQPGEIADALRGLAGNRREPREGQRAYAQAAAHAFQPRNSRDGPNLLVAEAGTGIGKTLGYLAPASLFARETGGAVWLSTYTRALQRQLRAEATLSLPELVAAGKVVVRKGRENYLCLLNLEDALQGAFAGRQAIFAELVARWARFSTDGDMVGGDLPGWLPGLFRRGNALPALSDRRGECIHAACPHYRRCFIEASIRAGAQASLVIANHALVMANAARARAEGQTLERIVFDEGHHLHAAADGAFSLALTGGEAIEMRRWLLGPDKPTRRAGRRRGLAARLLDVSSYDAEGAEAVDAIVEAARTLPAADWLSRLAAQEPVGPVEAFLAAVREQVLARASDEERGFSLEVGIVALLPGLLEAADTAARALAALAKAMLALQLRLRALAQEKPDWLDAPGLARIAAADAGLQLRIDLLAAWGQLLARLGHDAEPDFVDWFVLVRAEARELDCGVMRHWLDPLKPLARAVLAKAHGVVVTSATLGADMALAAGADYLEVEPQRFSVRSPFDYGTQARVFIVTDVQPRDTASLALAYARLIEAARGGTLGLFTAISRLRAVHARIADRLARAGLPLFAQHVDAVDTGTLVDLFRADPQATLFGTDALRDGVDVPGDSLRLIIFEGVPWSRPTVLQNARRAAFGGSAYEDVQVRQRLQQAFGRLIRRGDDRGVFVLLGAAVPSRLLAAFPAEVAVQRVTLAEASKQTRAFLHGGTGSGDCAPAGHPVGTGNTAGDPPDA